MIQIEELSPEQAKWAHERPPLRPPEIDMLQEFDYVLHHPDEVAASFDYVDKTVIQERIIESRLAEGDVERQLEKAVADPDIDLQGDKIERLKLDKEKLEQRLLALEAEEAAQQIRIDHLQEERRLLLEYAAGRRTEALDEALNDPTTYMKTALRGLAELYEPRSVLRLSSQSNTSIQRFGLLSALPTPIEVNGQLNSVPRTIDIDISVSFLPGEKEISAFYITTDLEGKLEHPHSLVLNEASPKNEVTGQPQIRVLKHGWKQGRPIYAEVTDDIEKLVIFQAVVSDLYWGVYGYEKADDPIAAALIRDRVQYR